ncbi:hypothetical protein MGYG_02970 [Nannizzia gypsea CBS 118893]|uniref:Uncharacterized protein n=1 Tax=Arthroderma gypseum (strain ATCC MYA-4604 / CBS 118893) TaxID=535722 RepID=E4UQ43_ARTGP|nr:hypothetical protein MGYG_02970 [Nannizzia gypsea CBS 118893]EFQ99962.1 hypothetical protein MGYG_02970 [Nannizzia gypsea CBS 118893]
MRKRGWRRCAWKARGIPCSLTLAIKLVYDFYTYWGFLLGLQCRHRPATLGGEVHISAGVSGSIVLGDSLIYSFSPPTPSVSTLFWRSRLTATSPGSAVSQAKPLVRSSLFESGVLLPLLDLKSYGYASHQYHQPLPKMVAGTNKSETPQGGKNNLQLAQLWPQPINALKAQKGQSQPTNMPGQRTPKTNHQLAHRGHNQSKSS